MYSSTARCRDMPDQVDGQDVGQGLGGERPAGAAGRQLGIHRRQRGPKVREVEAVERRERHPRRIEAERLGGDPRDQLRLEVDVERVLGPAPAPPGGAAGRHHQDRPGRRRYVPRHPFIPQVELLGRPGDKDHRVVGQGGQVDFRGGRRTVTSRLQTHPPKQVARRARFERDELAQFNGPEWAAASRRRLPHDQQPTSLVLFLLRFDHVYS